MSECSECGDLGAMLVDAGLMSVGSMETRGEQDRTRHSWRLDLGTRLVEAREEFA